MTIKESIQQSKYARAKKDWARQRVVYAICIFFPLAMLTLAMNGSCTKAAAQKPAALISSCSDTSGVYTPVVVSSFNTGTVTFNPAHFTRMCDEVYVSGTLSASNAFDTINTSLLQVSLPFASDVTGQNTAGNALIGFNGLPQPTMGAIGFVHLVGQTGAVISWQPVKKNFYGLIYEFSYTVK